MEMLPDSLDAAAEMRSRLRTDMATRAAYVSDASIFRRVPAAVLEVRSEQDIALAVAHARSEGLSVTGRGGGTSVAGNAIGEGLVLDTSRYFNKILEIDPLARTARIQPGVICDALRRRCRRIRAHLRPGPLHAQPLHRGRHGREQRVRLPLTGLGDRG